MHGRRLVFLGSKAAGLRVCRRLIELLPPNALAAVICPDDSADPRSVMADFEAAAGAIPFHIVRTRAETVSLLKQYAPECALVHGWYQIIPTAEVGEINFLGFHYSPLPRYRGNAPLVWQVLNGEQQIGVSCFELVAEMDAGRLYAQGVADLGPDETIADALAKADQLAAGMLDKFVADWLVGEVNLHDQPDQEPSYCGLRTVEDGRIDWRAEGQAIHDFVRAQTRPYPGAYTSLPDGRRLTIWASAREPRVFMGVPGGIAEITEGHVVVTAGRGAVRLLEVQVEGGGPAAASTVLRSLKLRLG